MKVITEILQVTEWNTAQNKIYQNLESLVNIVFILL